MSKSEKESTALKEKIINSAPVQIVKGIYLFAEGTALITTALYAIYAARYTDLPIWGAQILTVAGVLVLVPAAILLAKFFRNVAK